MQTYVGQYTGDGNETQVVSLPTGWGTPQAAWCQCTTDGVDDNAYMRIASAPEHYSKAVASNAAPVTTAIRSFGSDTLTIGSSLNDLNEVYGYWVMCPDSGSSDANFATGVYTGDGADNRTISTGQSWAPSTLLVFPYGSFYPAWRTAIMGNGDLTAFFAALPLAVNNIQALAAGSFQIGTGGSVNNLGTDYGWVAIKNLPGVVYEFVYVGNGTDDRNIVMTDPFQPEAMWVRAATATIVADRWSAVSGDNGQTVASAPSVNQIQAFNSDGFQVGTSARVNANTVQYICVALRTKYAIGASVEADYDLRQLAGLDVEADYGLRELAGLGLEADYGLREIAARELEANYELRGLAGLNLDSRYDLRQLAARELEGSYDLAALAGLDLDSLYALRQLAGLSLAVEYELQRRLGIYGADIGLRAAYESELALQTRYDGEIGLNRG